MGREKQWTKFTIIYDKNSHQICIDEICIGAYLNIIKTTYDKLTVNIIFIGKIFLKSQTRQGCHLTSLILNIMLEVLATAVRTSSIISF